MAVPSAGGEGVVPLVVGLKPHDMGLDLLKQLSQLSKGALFDATEILLALDVLTSPVALALP